MEQREVLACALSSLIYHKRGAVMRINAHLSDFEEIFSLPPKEIDSLAGEEGFADKLMSKQTMEHAKREYEWYESKGVEVLDKASPSYPPLLRECPDAPIVLYFRGNGNLANSRTISIIGTRVPSDYGIKSCVKVVEALGNTGCNPLIVSGLAVGIDINAHRNALRFGLETVAVLPCGIEQIYPAKNRDYAVQMLQSGGVLTEFPRGGMPLKFNFLQRNRIIAGMSSAVVVVESRISGGSMSTVEYAVSYGREVVAVPSRLDEPNSYGCNYLINRNIAHLYLNSSTIPTLLNWREKTSDVRLSPDLFSSPSDVKEKILLTLTSLKKAPIEEIVLKSGLEFESVCSAMVELELSLKVQRDPVTDFFELYLV